MALKLMYITNHPEVAIVAEKIGVDRIFVDMEYIGKQERQGGMDTVQSRHTIDDIAKLRKVISKSELLVRCNPIHEATEEYCSTEDEIERIIENGADIIMFPYFKTVEEVKRFLSCIKGRVRSLLLVETPEAVECLDEILALEGIDEILVGLNDLSLGYGKKFMFEVLADGTVETICQKTKKKNIPYGFGGIASLGKGKLPSEKIIGEHYRLGSTCVILSRSFCNLKYIDYNEELEKIFTEGVERIREYEIFCQLQNKEFFEKNRKDVKKIVQQICGEL